MLVICVCRGVLALFTFFVFLGRALVLFMLFVFIGEVLVL